MCIFPSYLVEVTLLLVLADNDAMVVHYCAFIPLLSNYMLYTVLIALHWIGDSTYKWLLMMSWLWIFTGKIDENLWKLS